MEMTSSSQEQLMMIIDRVMNHQNDDHDDHDDHHSGGGGGGGGGKRGGEGWAERKGLTYLTITIADHRGLDDEVRFRSSSCNNCVGIRDRRPRGRDVHSHRIITS